MSKKECSDQMTNALSLFFDFRLKNEKIKEVSYASMHRVCTETYKPILEPSKYAKNFVNQLIMDAGPFWLRDAENFFNENKIPFKTDEIDNISVKSFAYQFYTNLIQGNDPSYANAWLKSSLANAPSICENVSFNAIVRLGFLEEYLSRNVVDIKSSSAATQKLNSGVLKMIEDKDEKSLAKASKVVADFVSEKLNSPLKSYIMPFFENIDSTVCFELAKFDSRWNEFPSQKVKTDEILSGKNKDVNLSTAVFLGLCGSNLSSQTDYPDSLYSYSKMENSNLYFNFKDLVNLNVCEKQLSDEFYERINKQTFSDLGLSPLALLAACEYYDIDFPQAAMKSIDLYIYGYYERLCGVDGVTKENKSKVDAIVEIINKGSLDYWLHCVEELKTQNKISSDAEMILPLYRKWLNHKIDAKIEVDNKSENNTANKDYKL